MSALAPLAGLRTRVPLTRKNVGWGILGIMTLYVFIGDLPLLNPHNSYRPYHVKVAWVILPHLIFGITALLIGPLQFSTRIRRSHPNVHRALGRVYVGSVLIAAPFGLLIPFVGPKDPFFTIGVCVHASVWFITTLMAYLTARNRYIALHRQWIIRSYMLSFSFVIVRVLSPVWHLITIQQYGVADVIMSFSYVLLADILFSWKEITTPARATRVAPANV